MNDLACTGCDQLRAKLFKCERFGAQSLREAARQPKPGRVTVHQNNHGPIVEEPEELGHKHSQQLGLAKKLLGPGACPILDTGLLVS